MTKTIKRDRSSNGKTNSDVSNDSIAVCPNTARVQRSLETKAPEIIEEKHHRNKRSVVANIQESEENQPAPVEANFDPGLFLYTSVSGYNVYAELPSKRVFLCRRDKITYSVSSA